MIGREHDKNPLKKKVNVKREGVQERSGERKKSKDLPGPQPWTWPRELPQQRRPALCPLRASIPRTTSWALTLIWTRKISRTRKAGARRGTGARGTRITQRAQLRHHQLRGLIIISIIVNIIFIIISILFIIICFIFIIIITISIYISIIFIRTLLIIISIMFLRQRQIGKRCPNQPYLVGFFNFGLIRLKNLFWVLSWEPQKSCA